MKRSTFAAGLIVASLTGGVAGMLFEHYVGTRQVIDWAGMQHFVLAYRTRDTSDRTVVAALPSVSKRTMVALVFGQSNAANSGETLGKEHSGVYEYYRGRIYVARDPLLGAEGDRGSVWLRLGTLAVQRGMFDNVILVPLAVGTTEIRRWAPGGSLHNRLLSLVSEVRSSGIEFTHLLWHQGEADAMAQTSADEYAEALRSMIHGIRQEGVTAPLYVARATRCGRTRSSEAIALAQRAVLDPGKGILAGPDTDTLGFGERYDGCHFSTEGLERAAELWLDAIGRESR